ncbi:MAG: UDP-N-acetylmuramoyl-tripeptide--D-alanyl-D-alanine ligase [Oxalobacter sp.]|nr:MAG: UDP-N-acetylmuramoyl-tripeptide--D-alanyl-D-alanine ligase [Oxalobacter sp.]
MNTTLSQLQAWVENAKLMGDATVIGVSTDSRHVAAGNLFVALRGERFDAHDFLNDVLAKGASAVVVERVPTGLSVPALVVPDTRMALGEMARGWRQQFNLPVVGVTGSNGKTTVKEMIAAILIEAFGEAACLATRGNLNNEIGVPMTVLRLNAEHRAAVVELGMNHPGEIAVLTAIAQPTIGLVNNAQREHQEFMESVEAVAKENGAVIAALPESGVAVFPADDAYTALWREMAARSGKRTTVTFGLEGNADVICSYRPTAFGSDLSVDIMGRKVPVKLSAAGVHNVRNALAAIACASAVGIDVETIARGLERFSPVSGRMQRKTARNNAVMIDDTYNANPDSVLAAIDVLAKAPSPKILVLGDMGEVGRQGKSFHEEVGAYAALNGINHLLTLGELSRHTSEKFGEGAQHFADVESLLQSLKAILTTEATVLIKGSRFMQMERVVRQLENENTEGTS